MSEVIIQINNINFNPSSHKKGKKKTVARV